jgi:hypothetical protein
MDEMQFKKLNDIFIATLIGLFFNYTIQLQVNLAKNASWALLLMWTPCKMLHNKPNDNQSYIIIGPMRVEVVYLRCLLSKMTNPNENWDALSSSRKFIHKFHQFNTKGLLLC